MRPVASRSIGLFISLGIHLGGLSVVALQSEIVKKAVDKTVAVAISYVEPQPEAAPEPPPKVEPPKPEPKKAKKTPVADARKPPEPKPVEVPPPPSFSGLDQNSFGTGPGGGGAGVVVAVGNTLMAEPDKVAPDPQAVQPLPEAPPPPPPTIEKRVAPIASITRLPKLKGEVKPGYTPEAEAARIEGKVILVLFIDEQGKVAKVELQKGLGYGLDEKAIEAARQLEYEPAYRGQTPVAMRKVQVFNFILEQ